MASIVTSGRAGVTGQGYLRLGQLVGPVPHVREVVDHALGAVRGEPVRDEQRDVPGELASAEYGNAVTRKDSTDIVHTPANAAQ